MRNIKFLDIIRSIGGYLRIDNLAGYKETYVIDDLGNNDFVTKDILLNNTPSVADPFIYNIPAGSATPIIINFNDDTIKYGAAGAVSIGTDLSLYQANPIILFEIISSSLNTKPKDSAGWISNKEWFDSTYSSLVELTLNPDEQIDEETGLPNGLTADNINIIIKP